MDPDYQKRESFAVDAIKRHIPDSLKQNMLKECKGLFAEVYETQVIPSHYCVCTADGVGTKLLLAEAMGIYDTVGIDLVAMNSNDMATLGPVSPFLFLNYIAAQSMIEEKGITGDIIKGIVKGLEECDTSSIINKTIKINLGKGETASVDEMLSGLKSGYGFDIAAAMIGFIEKKRLKLNVKEGDKIIGFKSSGCHSNGFTDIRLTLLDGGFETRPEFKKRYKGNHKLDDKFGKSTIGQELLTPTRIYNKIIAKISRDIDIVGINNTGYGLKNFNRIKGNFEFEIIDSINPLPIFELLQQESRYTNKEMYQKFNMGTGFFIVVDKDDAEEVLKIAKEGQVIGKVKKSEKKFTSLLIKDEKIVFEGY